MPTAEHLKEFFEHSDAILQEALGRISDELRPLPDADLSVVCERAIERDSGPSTHIVAEVILSEVERRGEEERKGAPAMPAKGNSIAEAKLSGVTRDRDDHLAILSVKDLTTHVGRVLSRMSDKRLLLLACDLEAEIAATSNDAGAPAWLVVLADWTGSETRDRSENSRIPA